MRCDALLACGAVRRPLRGRRRWGIVASGRADGGLSRRLPRSESAPGRRDSAGSAHSMSSAFVEGPRPATRGPFASPPATPRTRRRSKPPSTLPLARFVGGEEGRVSPHRGARQQKRAGRTRRTMGRRENRLALASRTRSGRVFARERRIRSVRVARRLPRPSMGRGTQTLPKQKKQQRQGGQGLGSPACPMRRGRCLKRTTSCRARPLNAPKPH